MYVRLGFSVAVHVDPDILLVDEVLAVGDEHFARKCIAKIGEFQRENRTILFVTHSLDMVEQICSRGLVLNQGRLVFDGDPYFATEELRKILRTDTPVDITHPPLEPQGIDFGAITISGVPGGESQPHFQGGDPLHIRVPVVIDDRWSAPLGALKVVILGVGDVPVWSMAAERDQLPNGSGEWALDFDVAKCPPLTGRFVVATELTNGSGDTVASMRTSTAFTVGGTERPEALMDVPYAVALAESAVA